VLLDSCFLPLPIDGESIASKIYQIISDWELNGKILCITMDGGPHIERSCQILTGKIQTAVEIPKPFSFYLNCLAHSIQNTIDHCFELCPIEGEEISIKSIIAKIR
jgi:hypothetical protein